MQMDHEDREFIEEKFNRVYDKVGEVQECVKEEIGKQSEHIAKNSTEIAVAKTKTKSVKEDVEIHIGDKDEHVPKHYGAEHKGATLKFILWTIAIVTGLITVFEALIYFLGKGVK